MSTLHSLFHHDFRIFAKGVYHYFTERGVVPRLANMIHIKNCLIFLVSRDFVEQMRILLNCAPFWKEGPKLPQKWRELKPNLKRKKTRFGKLKQLLKPWILSFTVLREDFILTKVWRNFESDAAKPWQLTLENSWVSSVFTLQIYIR